MQKPLLIDLFCGLGGWSEGFQEEGWECIGFDIERHDYGDGRRYPGQLVLQDVLTLTGSQFRDASMFVASPPCQKFSYMGQPWTRARRMRDDYLAGVLDVGELLALFRACFRIQAEASAIAGRHIPLIVENVKGAQPWVGDARWHYGSFYLWGDVPALMPFAGRYRKSNHDPIQGALPPGVGKTTWFQGLTKGLNRDFGFEVSKSGVKGFTPDGQAFGKNVAARRFSSRSKGRRAFSALAAKIPLPLSRHLARVYRP